jgi:NAD(P)-dependent dehydrogenase (short-subunit alcohol dehydrogenase family)
LDIQDGYSGSLQCQGNPYPGVSSTLCLDHGACTDVKEDKVVLVTGGAKGIGRMISEGFVQNGAKVYIASRDEKSLQQACKELNALGKGSAHYIAADFYKEGDCKNLAEELKKREKSTYTIAVTNMDCLAR